MAKVYKLTFYAVDPCDYYDDAQHLFSQLVSMGTRTNSMFFRADEADLKTSIEFPWNQAGADVPRTGGRHGDGAGQQRQVDLTTPSLIFTKANLPINLSDFEHRISR